MEATARPERMVIKFGGGVITDKAVLKTPRVDVIDALACAVKGVLDLGCAVTLVHGAGSYGHLEAVKWRLVGGADESILVEQLRAVERVRADMKELNTLVVEALRRHGVRTSSHPPSLWAQGTGAGFEGDVGPLEASLDVVPVTFGDVVPCAGETRFGVLSGDDIMARVCLESGGGGGDTQTTCCVFVGDTPGLLSHPPGHRDSTLLRTWRASDAFNGAHTAAQDATGGIFLKAASAARVAPHVLSVWLVGGSEPNSLLELAKTGSTTGTRVLP